MMPLRTRRLLLGVLLVLALPDAHSRLGAQGFSDAAPAPQRSALERGFADPPASARTRCFWWWLNGNVTKAAITRDLEQLKAKGFGGALIFDAGGAYQQDRFPIPAGPMFGTPAWLELFDHAMREADRLGLELSLNIQSGWNLGGPDVVPDEAAKQLTWSRITVAGPRADDLALPLPRVRDGYYRDIAVLAYRLDPESARRPVLQASSFQPEFPPDLVADASPRTFWVSEGREPGRGPTTNRPEWLEIRYGQARRVVGTRVVGRPGYGPKLCTLERSKDGHTYETLARFELDDGKEAEVRIEPVEARIFRLSCFGAFDPRYPDAPRNVQVAEWTLLEPGDGGHDDHLPRPIRDLRQKAMFQELGGSAPDCRGLLFDIDAIPGEAAVDRSKVQDLTSRVAPSGRLRGGVPEGLWEIVRFGYTVSGSRVASGSGRWQGRAIDYLSTPALEAYWGRHVQPLLDRAGPLTGRALKYLHTDSWECGGMNWSAGFEGEFRKRRGYDPIPYLLVIGGTLVDSRAASNRFLADFRKTLGDCVAENHYQAFATLAHERRLGVHPESGGPHAGPFDALKCLGRNDITMGEFWVPSPHRPAPRDRFFVKQAASAAHIYGRRIVGAEGFTSIGPHWNDSLGRDLKPSFDHEACAGLNLTFIHTVTCSPPEMGRPGQEYFAGTHFNPNVTWWDQAGAFVAYLNRCHFLLQQGRFVADVCYYYGEHVPNLVRLKEDDPAGVLPGYDYDVVNEEVLLGSMRVENGRLVLAQGMSYGVLVLPDHRILSLAALRKVHELVREGATVVGLRPRGTASLVGYPESERTFQELANDLWGASPSRPGPHSFGKGRVVEDRSARHVLDDAGIVPDFECPAGQGIDYLHRSLDEGEVYFLANREPRALVARCRFRVGGRRPELWDPVRGTIRPLDAFEQAQGRTTLTLEFDPYGSLFVVFRAAIDAGAQGSAASNFRAIVASESLPGPWTVDFDPKGGGPGPVIFERLNDWTAHANPAIRFYSGTARYRTTFDLPPRPAGAGDRWLLDLGDVRELAEVRLNGKPLGVLWTVPFRVDITDAVKPVGNRLEVDVVNTWRNRLVGDRDLPPDRRLAASNVHAAPDWQPIASGLLGPARLQIAR